MLPCRVHPLILRSTPRPRVWPHHRRGWASSARPSETVKVHRRSSGSVTLDIHYPTNASSSTSANANANANASNGPWPKILLYLPRGPLYANATVDAACVTTLQKVWPHFIVQVNYRADRRHQYPTPVHDVLAGYDWVLEHLLAKRSIARAGRANRVGQVAVCGELLGGALATMLALTECHLGQPGVVAAAVNSPVLDWTDLYNDLGKRSPTMHVAESSDDLTEQLSQLRQTLFQKPEHYFDPFASPYLFFRSGRGPVPLAKPDVPLDDLEHLAMLEREEYFKEHLASSPGIVQEPEQESDQPKQRARRVFPSSGSGLVLPPFTISAANVEPLGSQAVNFDMVLRQSFLRQARKADFGRKVLADAEIDDHEPGEAQASEEEAEKKVQLKRYDGLVLWDDTLVGQSRVMEAAKWLLEKVT